MIPLPARSQPSLRVLGAAVLCGLALGSCALNGPGPLDIHEALLYGGSQERVLWVYGQPGGAAGQMKLRLGSGTVTLGAQAAPPALPGTLSVDGQATYRLPLQGRGPAVSVTRSAQGRFTVSTPPGSVDALYYTDGRTWLRLEGTSGVVSGRPVGTFNRAGQLTEAEAAAVSGALLGQGALAVAVLAGGTLPDAPLEIEPAPREYLRTGLFILPNVVTTSAPAPVGPVPIRPPATTPRPLPGATVNFSELASGTQASAQAGVQVATTQAQAAALYAQAYGRQTAAPPVPAVGTSTLVGVFMGQRPTGGYGIRVIAASVQNGVLTLAVQERSPGPGAITTQALTSPWTIVRVEGRYSQVDLVDEAGRPYRPVSGGGAGEVR